MSDIYPESTELYFINEHLKTIDNLNIRLDDSISNDKFNNYYFPLIKILLQSKSKK